MAMGWEERNDFRGYFYGTRGIPLNPYCAGSFRCSAEAKSCEIVLCPLLSEALSELAQFYMESLCETRHQWDRPGPIGLSF